MLKLSTWVGLIVVLSLGVAAWLPAADDAGFVSIFDGKTLDGWDGNPELWRVEDGAIVGQTKEKQLKSNTFLIWKGGQPGDFTLRCKWKMDGGNSGIQYRSKHLPGKPDEPNKWIVGGYQADMDAGNTYTGILYEERGRGILAQRGTTVVIPPGAPKGAKIEVTKGGAAADAAKIAESIKKGDWNEYEITCKGNHIVQKLNGLVTVDVTDNDPEKRAMSGIIAFQLHVGPAMKMWFKDIQLKKD